MLKSIKPRKNSKKISNGQTAVEYMLLLTAVVAIVLLGFKNIIPQTRNSAELFFNRAGVGIVGQGGRCGDGVCNNRFEDHTKCCIDCDGPISGEKCAIISNSGGVSGEY